jgi:hypothetical protein
MFRADFKVYGKVVVGTGEDRTVILDESYRVVGSAKIRVKRMPSEGDGKFGFTAHSKKPFLVVIYASAHAHLKDHLDGSMNVVVAEKSDNNQATFGKQALYVKSDGQSLVYPAGRPVWEPSLPV